MHDSLLSLDITGYIETVRKERKSISDDFLLDMVNAGYDTYDYLADGFLIKIKSLNKEESESALSDLKRIKEQSTTLLYLLEPLEIDTKNMSRVELIYGTLEEEIPKLIKRINRKLKL